jgi:hypothetical protein
MGITATTNLGAGNLAADATVWSTLQANAANGNQAAQTTAALLGSVGSGTTAFDTNGTSTTALTPVIASAQATLDSIVTNPALNLSRVLTSPSFAALVSALEGNSGSASGASDVSSGNGSSSAHSNTIGGNGENSSTTSSDTQAQYFAHLLGELESVMQTPTGGNTAESLLSGLSGGKLAVA